MVSLGATIGIVGVIIIIVGIGGFIALNTSSSPNPSCTSDTQFLTRSGFTVINSRYDGGGFGSWTENTLSINDLITVAHSLNQTIIFYEGDAAGLSIHNNFYFTVGSATYLATC